MRYPLLSALCTSIAAIMVSLRAADAPHDFAQWEKEIAAYEAADRSNPPPKGGIFFTGAATIRRRTTLKPDLDMTDMVLGPDRQPRLELFVADKLHISPAGHAFLAERIRPHLIK